MIKQGTLMPPIFFDISNPPTTVIIPYQMSNRDDFTLILIVL